MQVSEIGFGAWAIGGDAMIGTTPIGWGPVDDRQTEAAIRAALDAGINFFDTADIYGLGHSEDILGRVIGSRPGVIMASKGGNVARDNQFTVDYRPEHLRQACEASLKRLRRETIDFYQLHTARMTHLQQGDCIAEMEQLQRAGKIRFWGLSLNTFDPLPEANYLIGQGKAQGFQLVLNLLNQRALPLLAPAAARGYGLIARMPLQFGLLTGKFTTGTSFSEKDHRKGRLTPELIGTVEEALAPVWQLCEKYHCSRTQLALGYILSYAEISVVIPGIRTPEQVAGNTEGLIVLSPEDRTFIENWGAGEGVRVMEKIQKLG